MIEWLLVLNVCVASVCFNHHPEGGWTSKEACLLPVDMIVESAEQKLEADPRFSDEEHLYSWDCATLEDWKRGGVKLANHRTLGGKHV